MHRFVTSVGGTVNASGQVSFQVSDRGAKLLEIIGDHQQRRIAERFGLKAFGILQEFRRGSSQQRVGIGAAGTLRPASTRQQVGAEVTQFFDAQLQVFCHGRRKQRAGGGRAELLGHAVDERVGRG